jgi:hypothetical protein
LARFPQFKISEIKCFGGFQSLEMRKEVVKIVEKHFSTNGFQCATKKKREKDDERFVLHIWFIARFG